MNSKSLVASLFFIAAASAWVEPGRARESVKPARARSPQLERIAFSGAALLARVLSERLSGGAFEYECPAAELGRRGDLSAHLSVNGGTVQREITGAALRDSAARQAVVGAAILYGIRRERRTSSPRGAPATRAASLTSAVEERWVLEGDPGIFHAGLAPSELRVSTNLATVDPLGSRLNIVEASSARAGNERGQAAAEPLADPNFFPSARVTVDRPENHFESARNRITIGCAPGNGRGRGCGDEIERSHTARFRLPVRASIVRRFGEREGDQRLRGLVLSTDHAQPILAPGDGVVAYAGPFRTMGSLLIIEHRDAYHSLVIGASRLEVRAGDVVTEGQAIGWLARGPSGHSDLYVELRRAGEPVDPISLLSALEGEVRG